MIDAAKWMKRRERAIFSKKSAAKKKKSPESDESGAGTSQSNLDDGLMLKDGISISEVAGCPTSTYLPMSSDDRDYYSTSENSLAGKKWNLKITTWNVNGLRAWLKKDVLAYIGRESPDMLMLQEIKCAAGDVPQELKNVKGYTCYWYSSETKSGSDKSGYAGTALWSKVKPVNVKYGMGIKEHDTEGRLITAEYENFYLVGAYVPNSGHGLVRLGYRQSWNADFLKYLKDLDNKKPVIYTGDLNVAHTEIDLTNPKSNTKNAGFTKEERDDFSVLLSSGFTDAFRMLYPGRTGAYTFWTYMRGARGKNVGWRLDYFLVSDRLKNKVTDVLIRADVMGSDHCPVTLLIQE